MSDTIVDKAFALSGPISVQVRIAHGSVTVEPEDDLTEARVRVEADKHAADLLAQTAVDLRGNRLSVIAPRQGGIFDLPVFGPLRSGRGLHVHVAIPSGTDVKISTFT